MLEYIKGVRAEAKKINFPTTEEVRKNTGIVIVVCTVAALFLWGISEVMLLLLKQIV